MMPSLAQLGIKTYEQLIVDSKKRLEPVAVWENTMTYTTWWGLKSKEYIVTVLARTKKEAKEKMENHNFRTVKEI